MIGGARFTSEKNPPPPGSGTPRSSVESLIIDGRCSAHYIHRHAEDSPIFLGLAHGNLRGSMGTAGGFVSATPRGHWMEYGGPTNWLELPKEGQVHSWTSCQLGNGAFLKDRPCNLLLAAFDRAESLLLARPKDCVQGDTWVDMPIVAKGDPKPKYSITDVWVVPNKWAESRFGAPGRVVVRKR